MQKLKSFDQSEMCNFRYSEICVWLRQYVASLVSKIPSFNLCEATKKLWSAILSQKRIGEWTEVFNHTVFPWENVEEMQFLQLFTQIKFIQSDMKHLFWCFVEALFRLKRDCLWNIAKICRGAVVEVREHKKV